MNRFLSQPAFATLPIFTERGQLIEWATVCDWPDAELPIACNPLPLHPRMRDSMPKPELALQ
jgi:hypothetical protein